MKHRLRLFGGLMVMAGALSMQAQEHDNLTSSTDGVAVTITGYTGVGGAVVIPDRIDGLPVTGIGPGAFDGHTNLSSITIPAGVTNIGSRAFQGCTSLTGIRIPEGVPSIQTAVFCECTGLASVTIPSSVTTIEELAFSDCYRLGNLQLPSGLTSLGGYAFQWCTKLTAITIPDSLTHIGPGAFMWCMGLKELTIPRGVGILEEWVFNGCTSLTGFTIGDSVTTIRGGAFGSCSSLKELSIPGSVTNIETGAFFRCSSLTAIGVDPLNAHYRSVDGVLFNAGMDTLIACPAGKAGSYAIPDDVLTIEPGAFIESQGLIGITVPRTVTRIGDYAFNRCSALAGIYFRGEPPECRGPDVFFDMDLATIYFLPDAGGWGETFAGRPTMLWNPELRASGPGLGVGPGGFRLNVTGTADIPVVIEASAGLATAAWFPLLTNTLVAGSLDFSDAGWTNDPARIYRVRSP